MNSGMWVGVSISFFGLFLIMIANVMRLADEPESYRYNVACEGIIATVDVHIPRSLTQVEQEELRDVACAAIKNQFEEKVK